MNWRINFILGMGLCAVSLVACADDLSLARTKNCMNCHSVDRKVLGPAFTEIAKRYHTKTNGVQTLADKIINGSGGDWGVLKMPANRDITKAQSEQLAKWILKMDPDVSKAAGTKAPSKTVPSKAGSK